MATDAAFITPAGQFVAAGEYKIFVIDMGNPNGLPTILLHGGPGVSGWTNFGPTMPYFKDSDRRFLIVDMLQYGQSDKPGFEGVQGEWHALHLIKMMDSMGIASADFVCNSGGGLVALNLAADYPDRVRRMVITGSQPMQRGNDPTSPEFQLAGKSVMQNYFGDGGPTWEKARHVMSYFEWYDDAKIPDDAVTLRLEESLRPDLLAFSASGGGRGTAVDLEEKMKKIEAPTLFLWGRYDKFVVQTYPALLADLVKNGDVYIMDRCGHHPSEERPAAYAPIVLAFLDRPDDLAS